jgi:peptide chain release factor 1
VETLLSDPDIEVKQIAKLGKEMSSLSRLAALTDERNEKLSIIADLKAVEKEEAAKGTDEGEEMRLMVQEELLDHEKALVELEELIIRVVTPKDEADDKGVILEVRAGTGTTFFF